MQANPVDTFLQEADDALAEIEATALSLSGDSSGGDAVNQIFRAFHTIKGSGSMFGFDDVAAGRCEPGAGIGIRRPRETCLRNRVHVNQQMLVKINIQSSRRSFHRP